MTDQDTHVVAYGGQKYEVIEVGDHPHAHGESRASEDGDSYARYRCFECGTVIVGDDLDDARSKLKEEKCE